jgi:Rps23 Pro-64 3,4-dihydroxylase Tpa1-like proline 4-hydroxylase
MLASCVQGIKPGYSGTILAVFAICQGWERDTLTTMVEQHFNQLTVFDPRIPHGVATVEGVREPTEARVVLHGWFTSEGPFFIGAAC